MKLTTLSTVADRPIRKKPNGEPLWDLWRDGITQSALAYWLACPEKFRLRFIEGLGVPSISSAVSFGDLWHRAMESLYGAYGDPASVVSRASRKLSGDKSHLLQLTNKTVQALEAADRATLDAIGADAVAEHEHQIRFSQLEALLEPYAIYWLEEFQGVEWLSLEKEFGVPYTLDDGRVIYLRGKIDGVCRLKKRRWLFETKTKSRIDEDPLVEHLPMDMQVNMYAHAEEKSSGEAPEGVIYNIVRRPQLKLGKTETLKAFRDRMRDDVRSRPDHYFVRLTGTFDPEDQMLWARDFKRILHAFARWYDELTSPETGHYRNPFACITAWGACEYLRLCGRQDRVGLMRRETAFPELHEPLVTETAPVETPKRNTRKSKS